jgi:hypothetical protein
VTDVMASHSLAQKHHKSGVKKHHGHKHVAHHKKEAEKTSKMALIE